MRCVPGNGNDFFTDVKAVAANVTGAGFAVLYMSVYSARGYEANYNITLDLIPIFNCFPDFSEPNETINMPSLVASSSTTPSIQLRSLTMCTTSFDEDWFRLNPPAVGSRIEATIDFPQGDMFMELLGPLGNRACGNFGNDRCYSDGSGLSERIAFTSSVAGSYYLRVGSIYSSPNVPITPPDADTPYNLTINYTGP
jgi:hypothetical protein